MGLPLDQPSGVTKGGWAMSSRLQYGSGDTPPLSTLGAGQRSGPAGLKSQSSGEYTSWGAWAAQSKREARVSTSSARERGRGERSTSQFRPA